MNYAIILAGGTGSRFWPLSRELKPKQFLNICSTKPMIEETFGRINRLIKKENIYIATSAIYNQKIEENLRRMNIPSGNILFEPASKGTFAPILLLSKDIDSLDAEAVVLVLPSDHFVGRRERFLELLKKGAEVAKNGYIVSLGVPPRRPETGYGYIKTKSKINGFYPVEKFIEKPNLARARKFIRDKRYYWNSGIFIFRPKVILEEAKKLMPYAYNIAMRIKNKEDAIRLWRKLPALSVDYAIMERTKRMALLPACYGWVDIGSWAAICEIGKKDKNGNIFGGKYLDFGSKNSVVCSDNRLVVTLGLNNLIIADTKDALLVCSKERAQDVKQVVQLLRKNNFKGKI